MGKPVFDIRELLVRFILGGTAVVLCYLVSFYSPVKFIGGIFAAFPAVMTASVTMAGLREGSCEAGEVAKGAVSGMIGGTTCVLTTLYLSPWLGSWQLGLAGATGVWFLISILSNRVVASQPSPGNHPE